MAAPGSRRARDTSPGQFGRGRWGRFALEERKQMQRAVRNRAGEKRSTGGAHKRSTGAVAGGDAGFCRREDGRGPSDEAEGKGEWGKAGCKGKPRIMTWACHDPRGMTNPAAASETEEELS